MRGFTAGAIVGTAMFVGGVAVGAVLGAFGMAAAHNPGMVLDALYGKDSLSSKPRKPRTVNWSANLKPAKEEA